MSKTTHRALSRLWSRREQRYVEAGQTIDLSTLTEEEQATLEAKGVVAPLAPRPATKEE